MGPLKTLGVLLGVSLVASAATAALVRDDLDAQDQARVGAITARPAAFDAAEPFERMQAGATTSTKLVNANAFSQPSANLPFEDLERFSLGNGLFRKDWVSAPSSTQASDGLGPLYNARACQSCHFKDGRGHAPAGSEDDAVSLIVRLSVPPDEAEADKISTGLFLAIAEPTYGHQLQDFAVAGLPAEGRVSITYEDLAVELAGGEVVTLREPNLSIDDLGNGPMNPETMMSARIATPMIGLGLLEAIHDADILARDDPDDADGDGISGRAPWVFDRDGDRRLGRFGWKAIEPTVRQQTAHAFSADMGLSTPVSPEHWGECTLVQTECRALPDGAQPRFGSEEVPGSLLDLVAFYASNLAVPARRDVEDPGVLAGKRAFHQAGCPACHTPKYVTSRDAADPAHRFQLIWPHSDLLLHDMGEGLADHRPEGAATGREWRTPPLWGIGLSQIVNGQASSLHDGRARTLLEAVLWHGGEAQSARDAVVGMKKRERDDLVRFLESL